MSDDEKRPRVLVLTEEQAVDYGHTNEDGTDQPVSLTCTTCRWWGESVSLGPWHAYGCHNGVTNWDTPDEDRGCSRTDCKPEDHATDFGCVKWEARG